MQEEVNDKMVQVAVKVTKLTGRVLQAALKKLLAECRQKGAHAAVRVSFLK